MMRHILTATVILALLASAARAEVVSETWGGKGKALAHPDALTVSESGGAPVVTFDISAIAKGAKVHHASLYCVTGSRGQPRDPVIITPGDKGGERGGALKLEPPYYRSFDATDAVAAAVKGGQGKVSFTAVRFGGFDAARTVLAIRCEGTPAKVPPPVEGLRAVHHDGQTFLIWKELPLFRPDPEKVFWVAQYEGLESKRLTGPGEGFGGMARVPAVTLKTLRDLQGLSVRGKKGPREMEAIRVIRELPHIRYRLWRHDKPIDEKTIAGAELLGEVEPTSAIIERMLSIMTHGEYYDPWENPESVLLTWCVDAGKPVLPGEALYVHTPAAKGEAYYAVTVVENGRENASAFGAGNSLADPVAETPQNPQPVPQYVTPDKRDRKGLQLHHACWMAPPVCNLPDQDPKRVLVGVRPDDKPPYGLVVNPSASGMFFGGRTSGGSVVLTIEQDIGYGPDLGYSQGRGTLRSFAESKVDYYSDRYIMANVAWAMNKYQVDPARIICQANLHMALRHPTFFRKWTAGPFELDMNRRWNPGSGSLGGLFGPPETAETVDGHKAWDIVDIRYQLSIDPGKDIPYMACFFTQPKDGNHGAEYGWQDDPMGVAALRDFRQPYLMQWGGASVAREVSEGLGRLRWDRSVPAFSNCSLDNNPGTGDPDAGEPWGQINGYLFWEYDSIVDEPDKWAMTVYLVGSAPEDACTVDLTLRHCRKFKARSGQAFAWTSESAGKPVASGTVAADKHGRVTIESLAVTKARNRITVSKK